MWSRYRKYLELRDNWHIQEGTGEEGDALSSYYSDFYHRWWMDGAQIFGRISGISATLGVQSIRHVSGESASAGIQTRSRSGENALNEVVLRTLYVTRKGTALSSMRKLRASHAVTHSSARKKIWIWSVKVNLQFWCEGEQQPLNLIGEEGSKVCRCRKEMKWNNVALECQVSSLIFSFQQEYVDFKGSNPSVTSYLRARSSLINPTSFVILPPNVRRYYISSLFVLRNPFPSSGVSWRWLFRREVHKLCQQAFQKHLDGRGQLPARILRPIRD